MDFTGKKLLILGGNAETVPLVESANRMGLKTIVASSVPDEPAKRVAWKASDVDGMDVPGLVKLAVEEQIDGVLVGVADILIPSYCRVCDTLGLPCYATEDIVRVFSYKDVFKATFERYGIHGIPDYYLDKEMKEEDLQKIQYPAVVKPVDSYSGLGMTVVYKIDELEPAIKKALQFSNSGRFIVEKYMQCDDVGIYYTFKDGECSLSCIFDRFTCAEQKGVSRVSLGGIYPSKHIEDYYARMHSNAVRLFKAIGIKNGVLLLQAFYENGEFYVYDTGFRFQGEAPHLLMNAINGFDQREMLLRFAITGSQGDIDLSSADDPYFRGKSAATLWFLLKAGVIRKISGLDEIDKDTRVVANIQRLFEGDTVLPEWIGTEKQVLTRLYIVCESKKELADVIAEYRQLIRVTDITGEEMLLQGFSVEKIMEDEN